MACLPPRRTYDIYSDIRCYSDFVVYNIIVIWLPYVFREREEKKKKKGFYLLLNLHVYHDIIVIYINCKGRKLSSYFLLWHVIACCQVKGNCVSFEFHNMTCRLHAFMFMVMLQVHMFRYTCSGRLHAFMFMVMFQVHMFRYTCSCTYVKLRGTYVLWFFML